MTMRALPVQSTIPNSLNLVERKAEVETFTDVEQQTEEWHALRCGVLTASEFGKLVTTKGQESEQRRKLLYRLAGEILTGTPAETYSNDYMARGRAMEAAARAHYEFTRDVELTRVGFVRRSFERGSLEPIVIGCSPDSLIGDDAVLEIKTMAPHLLIETLKRGAPPTEHRAQLQGSLLVTGRNRAVLKLYYDRFPVSPEYVFERDDACIRTLCDAIEIFSYELRTLVTEIRWIK